MLSIFRSWVFVLALVVAAGCGDNDESAGGSGGDAGTGGAGGTGGMAMSTFEQETVDLPSAAQPAQTPGTSGVVVTNENLIAQFGGDDFSLNNASYTRYYLSDLAAQQPDAIVVLVPGFEGGAPLPEGRGRTDIVNQTQARNVDIPVIAFGGSNGLLPTPSRMIRYADTLATCAASSCDGSTARVVDRTMPNTAFPTFGDAAGGFEVYISEGYAHVDIVSAEDDATNNVIGPLLEFVQRNAIP